MPKYVKKQEIKLSDEDLKKLEKSITKAIQESNIKQMNEYSASREWMKFIMGVIIFIITGLLIVFGLLFLVKGIIDIDVWAKSSPNLIESNKILLMAILEIGLGFFAGALALFSILAYKELQNENDKNYIASMFSNIVALVALIIAFVALIKG